MTPWTCTGKQKVFLKKSHADISDTYSLNSYTEKGVLCEHTLSITLILKPIRLFQFLENVLHLFAQTNCVAL